MLFTDSTHASRHPALAKRVDEIFCFCFCIVPWGVPVVVFLAEPRGIPKPGGQRLFCLRRATLSGVDLRNAPVPRRRIEKIEVVDLV